MEKRIIIGKNDKGFYYSVIEKSNGSWTVIETKNGNIEQDIGNILDIQIDNIRNSSNLLFVKTNDDLVVIENYQQLNHDKVFKSFNEKVLNYTISKKIGNKNIALQKKSNHKRAVINKKVIGIVLVVGMFVMSSGSLAGDNEYTSTTVTNKQFSKAQESDLSAETEMRDQEIHEHIEIQKKAMENTPKISPEEEYYQSKIKEYSNMYFIDYNRALEVIEEHKEEIKNGYVNQEVGIIRVLANEFTNDSGIDKMIVRSDISALEREKSILKFAKVHEIKDVNTLATMLAVYRLETGNGTSPACVDQNNYGGLRARDSKTGNYYILSFKTSEIGAEAFVNSFLKIKRMTQSSRGYNPNLSLEANMNHIYCGEASWTVKVGELKAEVINDYNLGEYVSKEKPKQLIK